MNNKDLSVNKYKNVTITGNTLIEAEMPMQVCVYMNKS